MTRTEQGWQCTIGCQLASLKIGNTSKSSKSVVSHHFQHQHVDFAVWVCDVVSMNQQVLYKVVSSHMFVGEKISVI